jgi:hypothetical protein
MKSYRVGYTNHIEEISHFIRENLINLKQIPLIPDIFKGRSYKTANYQGTEGFTSIYD